MLTEEKEMQNPWHIQSIYDLQYFNCPSCVFKNHSKQEFINHVYEMHQKSIYYLYHIQDDSLKDIIFPKDVEKIMEELILEKSVDDPLELDIKLIFEESNNNPLKLETQKIKTGENETIEDPIKLKMEVMETEENETLDNRIDGIHEHDKKHCANFNCDLDKHVKIKEDVHVLMYSCQKCSKSFSQPQALNYHIRSVHCKNEIINSVYNAPKKNAHNYKCGLCTLAFSKDSLLKRHVDYVHYGPLNKSDIVYKSVKQKSKLKKQKKYKYDQCIKAFSDVENLKRHNQIVHEDSRVYMCNMCHMRYSDLKTHMDEVHKGVMTYKCEFCLETFLQLDQLKCHVKIHENDYKCKICEKGFCTSESLTIHEKFAHYECETCGKIFESKKCKIIHIDNEHLQIDSKEELILEESNNDSLQLQTKDIETEKNQPLSVNQLEIKIENKKSIKAIKAKKINILKESNDKHSLPMELEVQEMEFGKNGRFVCKICNKKFTRKVNLNRHISVVHEGLQQFQCKICGKEASRIDGLKSHMKTHAPKAPNCNLCMKKFATLKCVTCGKFFESENCLKIHINNEHLHNDLDSNT